MKIVAEQLDAKEDEVTRWAFMSLKVIGDGRSVYLKRLRILVTPWFSIFLHRIYRPDNQRELHDHPWSFLSIILRGWYSEDTREGPARVRRWFNFKRAEDRHSIRFVSQSPVWTLVFTGPRRRKWGFWVRRTRWATRVERVSTNRIETRWYPVDYEVFVPFDQYEKLNDA